MVHLSEHVYRVRVKGQIRIIHNPKSIKLMTKRTFTKYKLGSISPVEAINTVGATDAIL